MSNIFFIVQYLINSWWWNNLESSIESFLLPSWNINTEDIKFHLAHNLSVKEIMDYEPDIIAGIGSWCTNFDGNHWSLESIIISLDVIFCNNSNFRPLAILSDRLTILRDVGLNANWLSKSFQFSLENLILNKSLKGACFFIFDDVVTCLINFSEFKWSSNSMGVKTIWIRWWDVSQESISD